MLPSRASPGPPGISWLPWAFPGLPGPPRASMGIPWPPQASLGSPGPPRTPQGFPGFPGPPRSFPDLPGLSRASPDLPGPPWASPGLPKLPWALPGLSGRPRASPGFPGPPRAFPGLPGPSLDSMGPQRSASPVPPIQCRRGAVQVGLAKHVQADRFLVMRTTCRQTNHDCGTYWTTSLREMLISTIGAFPGPLTSTTSPPSLTPLKSPDRSRCSRVVLFRQKLRAKHPRTPFFLQA